MILVCFFFQKFNALKPFDYENSSENVDDLLFGNIRLGM